MSQIDPEPQMTPTELSEYTDIPLGSDPWGRIRPDIHEVILVLAHKIKTLEEELERHKRNLSHNTPIG